jgi:hypothetical protein
VTDQVSHPYNHTSHINNFSKDVSTPTLKMCLRLP